ncbi:MAG: MFS transporter, partial [Dehalococcoidia bacterium]|nr:MFS transporter [Dehalococcoidia bacterium]
MATSWGAYYSFGVFFKPVLNEFGWTRAMVSAAFSMATIVIGLLAIVTGRMTDRFGPRIANSICGVSLGIGY